MLQRGRAKSFLRRPAFRKLVDPGYLIQVVRDSRGRIVILRVKQAGKSTNCSPYRSSNRKRHIFRQQHDILDKAMLESKDILA